MVIIAKIDKINILGAATIAGGYFGSVDADFGKLPGLAEVISGYSYVARVRTAHLYKTFPKQ